MNEKCVFVEDVLGWVICRADPTISGLKLSDDRETVEIRYNGGGLRSACIACDSKLAIISDVVKECLR